MAAYQRSQGSLISSIQCSQLGFQKEHFGAGLFLLSFLIFTSSYPSWTTGLFKKYPEVPILGHITSLIGQHPALVQVSQEAFPRISLLSLWLDSRMESDVPPLS